MQTLFVTKFCYVKLLVKHKIFQSKLSSHEFYKVCHKNEIKSRSIEIPGDFAENKFFSFLSIAEGSDSSLSQIQLV